MVQLHDLNSILTRYQHHVGEYDKAKWEHTVEQRILDGIHHIPTKSAKLQSELIDLDLVRGSSFPKAKPKHGLFTVIRQASLRFIFLPVFHEWWTAQTSPRLFLLCVFLYLIQIVNLLLYWNCTLFFGNGTTTLNGSASSSAKVINQPIYHGPLQEDAQQAALNDGDGAFKGGIQSSEILSPLVLMIILTVLHSQIVATLNTENGKKVNSGSLYGTQKYRADRSNSKYRTKRRISRSNVRRKPNPAAPKAGALTVAPVPTLISAPSTSTGKIHHNLLVPGVKKVLFEDESKSWTSSNSDKDEGIAEEYLHENPENGETENDGASASKSKNALPAQSSEIPQEIINANKAAALKEFLEEKVADNNEQPETRIEHGSCSPASTEIIQEHSHLRKRNLSKLSEASTASYSCPDFSSNNNETTSEDDDVDDCNFREARSKSDWAGITTNSEDEDYGEDIHSDDDENRVDMLLNDHPFAWEFENLKTTTFGPSCASSDKVSCTIWEGEDAKKADLTVLDISSSIIGKVECLQESSDYLYLGIFFSCIVGVLPCLWRLKDGYELDHFDYTKLAPYLVGGINCALGEDLRTRVMILISFTERICLASGVFFLLAVAEKTYKQRFLYAKLFSRLTSSRKAKKSAIPHFRLNKVRNIKTWLSVRSYLRRRGPQRSVNTIVSASFIAELILIFFLSVELLKDSNRMYYLYNLEVIAWCLMLGIYLMRYMTLGSRISQKYRNLSVIITEQLNLYLKMEQKPHKKDELLVANNVLKLAAELLKELEDPFKISSFATNPYFYNVTRLVILSAFSGVLSEMLGFKLKLYKIKIK